MPIYIPKRATFSPPANSDIEPENDNDFLLDPDQLWDSLPQPYRMINKIISQVLDSVWEIIEKKEKTASEAAAIIPPPSLEQNKILQGFETVTAMSSTAEGEFLLLGLPNGLAVIDAHTLDIINQWEDEYAEIVSIHSAQVGSDVHLILTIDNLGTCRIFVYALYNLFCIKTVNENAPQAEVKILCQKCEISQGGEYFGVVLENSATHEVHVEIYKSAIETWTTEIENKMSKMQENETDKAVDLAASDKLNSQSSIVLEAEEVQLTPHTPENFTAKKSVKPSFEKLDHPSLTLAPPEIIAKLKPPMPLTAASSVLAAPNTTGKGGDSSEVLGMGLNHILNSAHLSRREVMFKHRNENLIKYLPEEKQENIFVPTVLFLPVSRLLPSEDVNTSEKVPASLALWWTGHTFVSHYSLGKTSKDLEWKPDFVWPYTSCVTCSAVSRCGTHLALGLADGSTVIWDWKMGLCKSVLKGPDKNSVKSVRFLDPSLYPIEQPTYPPYSTVSATCLLVEYSKGSQLLFDTWHGSHQIPQNLATEPNDDDTILTVTHVIPQVPKLMFLVEKSGKMYFKDITTGSIVCQIFLPAPYTLQSPWDPIFTFGDDDHCLFVKAEGNIDKDGGQSETSTCVFVFPLLSQPVLSRYFNNRHVDDRPLTVYNTLEQRIAALQLHRDQQAPDRISRWQTAWPELPSQLTGIQQRLMTRPSATLLSTNSFSLWKEKQVLTC
ncbi:hypothetical protein Btru_069135 [Bulinus truncatus]|nr:hypothetical protein Btru_069135 [Bulinus truncatus]